MLQTSYEAKTKDLWVFIETKDGKARNVGLELLNPGRRLAGIQGGKTVALVIGYNCDEAVKEAIAHGADKVLVVDNEVYDHYSTDAYTAAIVHCVEADCPTTILMGASPMGRDLGPRVAGRLKTGLTADCTSLDIDEATGKVAWTRPAFGGNLMATILCPFTFPQIGTCRPGVNKKLEADYSRTAEVEKVDFVFPADQIRIKVIETIPRKARRSTWKALTSSCPAAVAWVAPRASTPPSSPWLMLWALLWALPVPPLTPAGSPTPTRLARPVRPLAPSCMLPAVSPAPSSTWLAWVPPTSSLPSTRTLRLPSSVWLTWVSSATCMTSAPL